MTVVYISLLPLYTIFSVLSMFSLHWKFVEFSLIYQKHLIEFSMSVSFHWNCNCNYCNYNGIDGNLLKLIKSSFKQQMSTGFSNGQSSWWKSVKAGVPQGSVLDQLFFLIYIKDLPLGLTADVKLLVDDASLFSVVNNA